VEVGGKSGILGSAIAGCWRDNVISAQRQYDENRKTLGPGSCCSGNIS